MKILYRYLKTFNRQQQLNESSGAKKKCLYVDISWLSFCAKVNESTNDKFNMLNLAVEKIDEKDSATILSSYERIRILVQVRIDLEPDFAQMADQLGQMFDSIVFISSTADAYYYECMLNRKNLGKFRRELWPNYREGTRSFVQLVKATRLDPSKIIVVDSSQSRNEERKIETLLQFEASKFNIDK